jgi:hypothetical protein
MLLRVEQGKGHKDRYALPPILLERLRIWWRHAHAAGKILPGGYLFPGAYSADGDRRFRFIVTGLEGGEVLGDDDNSVGHDGLLSERIFGSFEARRSDSPLRVRRWA